MFDKGSSHPTITIQKSDGVVDPRSFIDAVRVSVVPKGYVEWGNAGRVKNITLGGATKQKIAQVARESMFPDTEYYGNTAYSASVEIDPADIPGSPENGIPVRGTVVMRIRYVDRQARRDDERDQEVAVKDTFEGTLYLSKKFLRKMSGER